MRIQIIIFIILILVQYLLHEYKCEDKRGKLLLLFHHIFSIYLIFGSLLFGYYKIHLSVIIISLIIHIIFVTCPLTTINNILCDQPLKKPMITYLNHIIEPLSLTKKTRNRTYHILLIGLIIYDIYKGFIV